MTKAAGRVVAKDLLHLLEVRHTGDVFIPECKDGPTQYAVGHVRMDAWVMPRSWAHPAVIGYEIKASRSDFLKDEKWRAYLPLCNMLYFVCPSGLISPQEVPEGAGLIWAAKTGTRLYTKVKAPHRDVDIPETLWRYIVMCRAQITRDNELMSEREFWEHWLEAREIDHAFGRRVGKAIKKTVADKIAAAEAENRRLRHLMNQYDSVRRVLSEFSIDPDNPPYFPEENMRRQLKAAASCIPEGLMEDIKALERCVTSIVNTLPGVQMNLLHVLDGRLKADESSEA